MAENPEPGTQNRPYSYRNLLLWQKAQELTLAVIQVVSRLPRNPAAAIGRQIIGSASSIAANVAEGHGRFSLPAHRNHLSIGKGSACETDGWLDLLRRAGFLDAAMESRLHEACDELIRMLTAKIVQFERVEKSKSSRLSEEMSPYTPSDYVAGRFSVLGSAICTLHLSQTYKG